MWDETGRNPQHTHKTVEGGREREGERGAAKAGEMRKNGKESDRAWVTCSAHHNPDLIY